MSTTHDTPPDGFKSWRHSLADEQMAREAVSLRVGEIDGRVLALEWGRLPSRAWLVACLAMGFAVGLAVGLIR